MNSGERALYVLVIAGNVASATEMVLQHTVFERAFKNPLPIPTTTLEEAKATLLLGGTLGAAVTTVALGPLGIVNASTDRSQHEVAGPSAGALFRGAILGGDLVRYALALNGDGLCESPRCKGENKSNNSSCASHCSGRMKVNFVTRVGLGKEVAIDVTVCTGRGFGSRARARVSSFQSGERGKRWGILIYSYIYAHSA